MCTSLSIMWFICIASDAVFSCCHAEEDVIMVLIFCPSNDTFFKVVPLSVVYKKYVNVTSAEFRDSRLHANWGRDSQWVIGLWCYPVEIEDIWTVHM